MRRKFISLMLVLSFGLFFISVVFAETFDIVKTPPGVPKGYTVWQVERPNVKKHMTEYRQIQFQPGDMISIEVGGCVQTGGAGRTWKRYWNPSGPNSDRLYYGMIQIPGLTNGLTPIRNLGCANVDPKHPDRCKKVFTQAFPGNIPASDRFLRLGYMDDNYSDNGYWGHDDGTQDQCKNVDAAFVIVSIGHGKPPLDPQNFVGIPPEYFRCAAAWKFQNFNTSELSWSTFTDAFDLAWYDYLNPITYIMFAAGRGMASGGNCAGMSLLAVAGEDAFAVEDLQEYFWDNYSTQTISNPHVQKDINTAHWKQLSTYFVTKWLHSRFDSPSTTARHIQQDLANGNYGLLSIENGSDGHVIVPLSVQTSGSKMLIQVYDSNRPCASYPDNTTYPPVTVDGDNWSFPMGNKVWTQSGGNIAYVSYALTDGWRDLVNGLGDVAQIIFGSDTTVEQITDKSGRQLFKNVNTKGLGVLDTSAKGLGKDIVRITRFGWGHKVPRTAGPKVVLSSHPVPSQYNATVNQMRGEYEQDYSFSRESYLVRNSQLEELNIKLSNSNPNKPVRALVHRQGQWHDVKFEAAARGVTIHPSLTLHKVSDLSKGVTANERNGVPMKVNFAHGLLSRADKNVTIQRADKVDVGATPIKAHIDNNRILQLSTTGPEQKTNINTHVIDSTGTLKNLPVRMQTIMRTQ